MTKIKPVDCLKSRDTLYNNEYDAKNFSGKLVG
jgi:hypothetical protein